MPDIVITKKVSAKKRLILKEYIEENAIDYKVAFIDNNGKTFLDEYYWDYSTTTGKYRNMFLGNWGINEAREKIKSGEYKLKNLN